MMHLLHKEIVYYVQGLGFRIHSALGGGHAEEDYENALAHLLQRDGIPFLRQPLYRIQYQGRQVGEYRPDLVLKDGMLLLELKAASVISGLHVAQTISYLGVTGAELGLIMNFGGRSMQFKRVPNFITQRQAQVQAHRSVDVGSLLFPELVGTVLDGLYQIHHQLGPGFLHQIYRRSARIELGERGLAVRLLKELPLRFDGITIGVKPVRLLLVEDKILVATVAMKGIESADAEKLRWAMSAVGVRLGIIANFYPSALDVRFQRRDG